MDTMRWEKLSAPPEYRDDGVAVTGYVPNEYYNQIQ